MIALSMLKTRYVIAATVVLIVMPRPNLAVGSPTPEATMRRFEKRVSSSEALRLETTTGRFELQRPWLSQGMLGSNGDSLTFRLDDVRTIHARRSYAGRGATIGLLSGAALGGVLAAYSSAATEPGQRSGSEDGGQAIGLVAAGAAVGIGIGLLLGAASSGWKKIYERPGEGK
jgi:hypothetical protein